MSGGTVLWPLVDFYCRLPPVQREARSLLGSRSYASKYMSRRALLESGSPEKLCSWGGNYPVRAMLQRRTTPSMARRTLLPLRWLSRRIFHLSRGSALSSRRSGSAQSSPPRQTLSCHRVAWGQRVGIGLSTRRSRMYQLNCVPSFVCVCLPGVNPARRATAADPGFSGSTWITASSPPSLAAYWDTKMTARVARPRPLQDG